MRAWRKKIEKLSLHKKIAAAMFLTPVISSLIIFCFYYSYMKEFYHEKVEIFQENNRENMTANLKSILHQIDNVSDQVLGMAVLSEDFDGYSEKDDYEKLLLRREITGQFTNICISNEMIDHIYMLDFEGNGFSSNSEWDLQEYLEEMDFPLDPEQKGRSVILPPHRAGYRSLGSSAQGPYVLSFVTYLNRFTKSGSIGLIQIDILYSEIEAAMELLEMTELDFSFVADEDGYLIYAPKEEDAGKLASEAVYSSCNLGEIMENPDAGQNSERSVVSESIEDTGWTLIQVNSNAMLAEEMGKMQRTWILIFLVCLICAGIVSLSLSHSITKPIISLIRSMGKVSRGNFDIRVEVPESRELAELAFSFNSMIQEVDSLMKENIQKEHEKTRLQMMTLNAKINSHFLYNTLNTVKWQAISKKQMEIANSIVALTKILEYSYKDTPELVQLKEEIRFIEDYIYIQNIRYGHHVKMEYEMEEGCENLYVLKMLLQPVVENALLHAFDNNQENNRIVLQCNTENQHMKIRIFDNGRGFQYEGFDKLTGIGLNNIKERLELNYGTNASLEIESTPGKGTCVTMKFLLLREGEDIQ
ncbi:MAG: sensor histidine kinase [Eubacteriales bacterium]|nr:sensor histidine kinase [Eubacteriales bacterium]